MRSLLLLPLVLVLAATAQVPPSSFMKEANVWDRSVVLLSSDKLELAVATQGSTLLRLLLQGDPEKLNPFGNPERFPDVPQAQKATAVTGYFGHFICVDGFGPVSVEERAAGLPQHGEAHLLPWELVSSAKEGRTATLKFLTKLPLAQETLSRTIQMVDGENVIYVSSELENQLAFDRPVNWTEHVTLGSPFLEPLKTLVDFSGERSQTRPYTEGGVSSRRRLASQRDFTWPMAPARDGASIDMRGVPASPNSMDHITTIMDPSRKLVFVTALNTARQYLLGYLFRREEYPWMQQWQNYAPSLWLSRGLEFGTQPYDVPRREAISMGALFDTPTFRWLPAKSKISSRFLLFFVKTPAGMSKIDDVRLEDGKIIVEDRAAGQRIVLAASLPL